MSKILLGVSGGIAAYKACDIVSKLRYRGHDIQVVLTENAKLFITKVTLAALSQNPVLDDLWTEAESGIIDHIDNPQRWADILVVAPATQNVIHKFATGAADDYLSTMFSAACGHIPRLVAPAMNTSMWNNPATQRNVAQLSKDGVFILEPASGRLACGTVGEGKLPTPEAVVEKIETILSSYVRSGAV